MRLKYAQTSKKPMVLMPATCPTCPACYQCTELQIIKQVLLYAAGVPGYYQQFKKARNAEKCFT